MGEGPHFLRLGRRAVYRHADVERFERAQLHKTADGGPSAAAEAYLSARGLADPGAQDLLFHPDLSDFETRRGWPGLVALPRLVDGSPAPGIHRTFLLDDGSAKAPAGKKMLGSVADAAVRLFPLPDDGHLGVAEGIETALAAHALFGTAVWAALSADGMARFRWPEGTRWITIYADAGDAGRRAAATLADRLNAADIPNTIVLPLHGDDFNDDLLRGARAADYGCDADPADPVPPAPPGNDADALLAAATTLTNPPDLNALGQLLGRIALMRPEPLLERQVLDGIKRATGIPVSILERQLGELRRKGGGGAPVPRPRWFGSLRLDLAGAPERNEANVILAFDADEAFAGALVFDEFRQEITVCQPLPWEAGAMAESG